MKRVIKIILFLLFSGICLAQQGPNMFNSYEAAKAAYETGSFSYYQPKNFGGRVNHPTLGETLGALSSDAIVEMPVAIAEGKWGRKYVVLEKGTPVWLKIGIPTAHAVCGNTIYFYKSLLSSLPPIAEQKSLAFKPEKGDKGDQGLPGRDGVDGKDGVTKVIVSSFIPWWGWVLAGAVVGIIVDLVFFNHHNTTPTTTGVGPGGSTGPAFRFAF